MKTWRPPGRILSMPLAKKKSCSENRSLAVSGVALDDGLGKRRIAYPQVKEIVRELLLDEIGPHDVLIAAGGI